jgi:hypothetical protein
MATAHFTLLKGPTSTMLATLAWLCDAFGEGVWRTAALRADGHSWSAALRTENV